MILARPLAFATVLIACTPVDPNGGRVLGGGARLHLELRGQMYLDEQNDAIFFRFADDACKEERDVMLDDGTIVQRSVPCAFGPDSWASATLATPWGQKLVAQAGGDRWVGFRADWAATGIDPLDSEEAQKLSGPWILTWSKSEEPLQWRPTPHERVVMLAKIGQATETEVDVQDVKAAPSLAVASFAPSQELRNGASSGFVLRVKNEGQGTAYRVYVTTRSNVPQLHGLQFSFGRLDPGQTKARKLQVAVPRDNSERDAVIVMLFHEAHDFVPGSVTQRFPIRPATDTPQLVLACRLRDAPASDKKLVDAGQVVHVVCDVRNSGASAAVVNVSAGITGGGRRTSAEPISLPADRGVPVSLPIEVPRSAQMDSKLVIDVTAKDPSSPATASYELEVTVARPKICPSGKLTREEFKKKREEYRKAVQEGLISPEDYARLEDELVGCLD